MLFFSCSKVTQIVLQAGGLLVYVIGGIQVVLL